MPDRLLLLPEIIQASTAGPTMREYRLLSQQQRKDVAEMLGIGPGTLSNWEYGRSPFTTDYLVKFAHILNLEVVLFDRAEFQRVYPDHYERVKRL